MRILIAEDDRVSRTFLMQFMGTYGTCDAAVDGMETLDYFMDSVKRKEPYDLLCLDIMMPKVDGLRVLRVIRTLEAQREVRREDHLPIIMMTAITDSEHVDEAFRLGCDAYASKPIDVDEVIGVMRELQLIDAFPASGEGGPQGGG